LGLPCSYRSGTSPALSKGFFGDGIDRNKLILLSFQNDLWF
jgi:hypothetical protein